MIDLIKYHFNKGYNSAVADLFSAAVSSTCIRPVVDSVDISEGFVCSSVAGWVGTIAETILRYPLQRQYPTMKPAMHMLAFTGALGISIETYRYISKKISDTAPPSRATVFLSMVTKNIIQNGTLAALEIASRHHTLEDKAMALIGAFDPFGIL